MTTQMLIPTTTLLAAPEARSAIDSLLEALEAAEQIPTTEGVPSIAGPRTAAYGPLIRFETDRFTGDPRGVAGSRRLVTYTTPADATDVLLRFLHEGRDVHTVQALRAALGGTTTR